MRQKINGLSGKKEISFALCLTCGYILISEHVHDFVSCDCGNFIDGGLDYTRMGCNHGHSMKYERVFFMPEN